MADNIYKKYPLSQKNVKKRGKKSELITALIHVNKQLTNSYFLGTFS